nr:hypothetical protein CoNPh37_CDS0122 [Staphylococcus phage S-CoN_Ph37]
MDCIFLFIIISLLLQFFIFHHSDLLTFTYFIRN